TVEVGAKANRAISLRPGFLIAAVPVPHRAPAIGSKDAGGSRLTAMVFPSDPVKTDQFISPDHGSACICVPTHRGRVHYARFYVHHARMFPDAHRHWRSPFPARHLVPQPRAGHFASPRLPRAALRPAALPTRLHHAGI